MVSKLLPAFVAGAFDPTGIEGLSIDFDGTLAPRVPHSAPLWPTLVRHASLLGTWASVVEAHRGRRSLALEDELVLETARAAGRRVDEVRRILDRALGDRWARALDGVAIPSGLSCLLEWGLEVGLGIAIVSDHPSLARSTALGLHKLSVVIDARTLGALKPAPDALLAAAAQLGIPPSSMLHVGDRWDTDAAAAHAAGCRFLHIEQLPTD